MIEQHLTNDVAEREENFISEFSTNYARIMQHLMNFATDTDISSFGMSIGTLFAKAALSGSTNFEKLTETYSTLFRKQLALSQYIVQKARGKNDVTAVIEPNSGDARFRSEPWRENLWFDAMKQSYLIGAEFLDEAFADTSGLNEQEERKLNFYKKQWIDSLAPNNFLWTNPDVLEMVQRTGGKSLLDGMKNFSNDLELGAGVQMVDRQAFELGHNIATSRGNVVARNRLCELIQYKATTKCVRENPILIIPPWINKYYILDLSPKNSFIRWLVGQGYSVFVISWVNPDESFRDTTYDDYMELGPLFAADAIQEITQISKMNVIGYCLGGTLLASLLGYLENSDEEANFVNSATFFTTMIDFSEPGDLGVFVDEASVSNLEKKMNEIGYLDGKSMASTFSMMRANDLIWYFVINNYLLGKKPGNFDLLYWNSDSTRMPAKMHSYYLRKMYIENLLSQPNGLTILGRPIDLRKVKIPAFFVSTQLDHIAPWQATYRGAKIFNSNVRFLLGESGHIAGVINPPQKNKYGYWTDDKPLPNTSKEWFENTTRQEGSWWLEWENWIRSKSGGLIDYREIGSQKHPPLAQAPGEYVKL